MHALQMIRHSSIFCHIVEVNLGQSPFSSYHSLKLFDPYIIFGDNKHAVEELLKQHGQQDISVLRPQNNS